MALSSIARGEGAPAAAGPPAPPPPGARGSLRVELTDLEAAALLTVVLRAEGEVLLRGLAEQLGLADRQLGMGLGLLILDGTGRIREEPKGFVVFLVETGVHPRRGASQNRR